MAAAAGRTAAAVKVEGTATAEASKEDAAAALPEVVAMETVAAVKAAVKEAVREAAAATEAKREAVAGWMAAAMATAVAATAAESAATAEAAGAEAAEVVAWTEPASPRRSS